MDSAMISPHLNSLSPRERDLAIQVASGRPLKQVAKTWRRSVKTVQFHHARLKRKLGIECERGYFAIQAAITRYAIQKGLVEL